MKLREVKIKIVMKAENVSRERAIKIIAERQKGKISDDELAVKTHNISGGPFYKDDLLPVEDLFCADTTDEF